MTTVPWSDDWTKAPQEEVFLGYGRLGHVLCYIADGEINISDGDHGWFEPDYYEDGESDHPTHWMRLPSQPAKEPS